MRVLSNEKLKTWIPKKYRDLVTLVDQDSEVWEVLLIDGYSSVDGETTWVFGKDRYHEGDYTQQRIKQDLQLWLSDATKTTKIGDRL
jgi:hypothetical protein